jgi:RNA polymerase sigma-70 factor (ECF subfamily)
MIQLATVQIGVDGREGQRQVKPDTRRTDPDADDVAAASSGDLEAAERLYRRHRTRVTNVARILTGNTRDAEDVCQETFMKALGGLSRFRGEAAFSSWLYRIAINQARNLLAKERRARRRASGPWPSCGSLCCGRWLA